MCKLSCVFVSLRLTTARHLHVRPTHRREPFRSKLRSLQLNSLCFPTPFPPKPWYFVVLLRGQKTRTTYQTDKTLSVLLFEISASAPSSPKCSALDRNAFPIPVRRFLSPSPICLVPQERGQLALDRPRRHVSNLFVPYTPHVCHGDVENRYFLRTPSACRYPPPQHDALGYVIMWCHQFNASRELNPPISGLVFSLRHTPRSSVRSDFLSILLS